MPRWGLQVFTQTPGSETFLLWVMALGFVKKHLGLSEVSSPPSPTLCCFFAGLPKMQVIRSYTGTPPPAPHEGPPLHIQAGDTVELLRGDAHSLFWQVRSQGARGREEGPVTAGGNGFSLTFLTATDAAVAVNVAHAGHTPR